MNKIEKLTHLIYNLHADNPEFTGIYNWVFEVFENYLESVGGDICDCCLDTHGLYLSTWGIDPVNVGFCARARLGEEFKALSDYTDEEIGQAVLPVLYGEWYPIVHHALDEDEGSAPPVAPQLN